MGIVEPTDQKQVHFCFICNGPGTQRHHLYPRGAFNLRRYAATDSSLLSKTVRVCKNCHIAIHFHFSHRELADKFNTPEALKRELEFRKSEDPYSKMVLVQGMNPTRVKSQFEKYALRRW